MEQACREYSFEHVQNSDRQIWLKLNKKTLNFVLDYFIYGIRHTILMSLRMFVPANNNIPVRNKHLTL